MKSFYTLLLTAFFVISCSSPSQGQQTKTTLTPNEKVAYFASGCFWCVEAIYEHVKGVREAVSGYAGATAKNPTYQTIKHTGHAETVAVYYDPTKISYADLIDVYYASQNPTTYGQNPDFGANYRSIIFYSNADEKQIAEQKLATIQKRYDNEAVTELKLIDKFYPAEAYHQNFERRNPNHGYIKAVSIPRLYKFQKKRPDLLKK